MKAQNKFFSILVTSILLANVFVPNFVWAADEPIEPVPTPEAPVEEPATPTPTPDPIVDPPATPTDTTAPVITLLGESTITLTVGDTFSDPGATATDETDGTLSPTVSGTVDTAVTSTYTLTYSVSDAAGNVGNASRTVIVQEPSSEPLVAIPVVNLPENLPTVSINFTVATADVTLVSEPTTVTACESKPGTGNYTVNAWCAVDQVAAAKGWTIIAFWSDYGVYLKAINEHNDDVGTYWLWFNGTELGGTGLNDHILLENENLSLVFGTSPLKVSVDNATPLFGTTTTVSVYQFGFDETWSPAWTLAENSQVRINGRFATTTNGMYEYYNFHPNPIEIIASKPNFITSQTVKLNPVSPTTPIRLKIQTFDQVLFDDNLSVSVCNENSETADTVAYSINAWCAVEQAARQNNLSYQGNWFGSDVFLEVINDYSSDFSQGKFWSWYHNVLLGETGLNKHYITENEEILLTFKINPIKLEVSSSTPTLGSTETVSISELDFTAWPAAWVPLTSSTLYINDTAVEAINGSYEFIITSTTTLKAVKAGYVDSNTVIVLPFITANQTTDIKNPDSGNSGSGGSSTPNNSTVTFNLNSAAEYLHSQQKATGAIGSAALYSDWAAIAIGSLGNSDAKAGLMTYLKTDPNPGSAATDYERRAMALLALGINPYSDTKTNYIGKITATFDGTQFGDAGLVNDDIFALFPLLKSGYSTSDPEIQKTTAFILSKQNSSGGWESPDLTAAAVQALSEVKSLPGVEEALVKAKNYLKVSTKTDGRIGDNAFSTGWGLQALSALGESAASWNGTGVSPISYLTTEQQSDGGVGATSVSIDNRVWSTSYAIPGVQSKTWSSIMTSVSKPSTAVIIPVTTGTDNTTSTSTPTIATSTPATPTTTPIIATTTLEITVPSSTIEIIPEIITVVTPPTTEPITVSETTVTVPALTPVKNEIKTVNTEVKTTETQTSDSSNLITVAADSELKALPPETPESQRRALFGSAAALAGSAGAYLAWRFLQGLA